MMGVGTSGAELAGCATEPAGLADTLTGAGAALGAVGALASDAAEADGVSAGA
jgi:hypothetical protein